MKYLFLFFFLFFGFDLNAQDVPADALDAQSILVKTNETKPAPVLAEVPTPVQVEPVPFVVDAPSTSFVVENATCCDEDTVNIVYRNKRHIAPNAVTKTVVICFCESSCENCKLVNSSKEVPVDICVPACPCKETVSVHRGGRKVVYDFGKYEVIIFARKNGTIEVDYKRRLFDR
jgi:hypothetical protein